MRRGIATKAYLFPLKVLAWSETANPPIRMAANRIILTRPNERIRLFSPAIVCAGSSHSRPRAKPFQNAMVSASKSVRRVSNLSSRAARALLVSASKVPSPPQAKRGFWIAV